MKVLVVGAGGYVGTHLVQSLKNRQIDYVTLSSSDGDIDPQSGTLINEHSLPSAVDCVVFLSQSPFYRQAKQFASHLFSVNVNLPISILQWALEHGAKKFIYASSGNVYRPSVTPIIETSDVRRDELYALSKLHAEEVLANFSNEIEVNCLRIFGVYGPQQKDKLVPNLFHRIKEREPVFLDGIGSADADPGLRLSLCFIDDLVEVFCFALSNRLPGVLNVAGSESTSIRALALELASLAGLPCDFVNTGKEVQGNYVADISRLIESTQLNFTGLRQGLEAVVANATADISKLKTAND